MNAQDQKDIGNWLASGDTGTSSKTMAAIALGADTGRFDAPYDPSDFGRCYRLVQEVPAIFGAFEQIGKLCPPFAGILREWDELVRLYNRDFQRGESTELYERIKTLRRVQVQPPSSLPANCGSGHCSCIECFKDKP